MGLFEVMNIGGVDRALFRLVERGGLPCYRLLL